MSFVITKRTLKTKTSPGGASSWMCATMPTA